MLVRNPVIVKKSIMVLPVILALSVGAAAQAPAPSIDVAAIETCREHIVAEPRITAADWPKRARGREVNAYVVITYNLDGSGKPQDARVTDSLPKGLFDESTLGILSRTTFAPAAVAQGCVYVRTYGSVRRAAR